MKDGRIRLHDGRTWTPTPSAYAWLQKLRNHGPQKAWPPGIATGSNTMDAGWVEFVLSMPDGRNVRAGDATPEELHGTPPERWWTHLTEAGRAALQLDADRQVVRKAMGMVVKSPKTIGEMEDEVREFLRSASPAAPSSEDHA